MNKSIRACARLSIILLLMYISVTATAQRFIAAKNSTVEYRVYSHRGGNTLFRGLFPDIKGTIVFNPKELAKASFDIIVNPANISTANSQRDKDLSGPSFLDALKYPQIRIKSTSITLDGKVIYILHGNLTLKGITKPVNIQFTATPTPGGYLFRGSFQVSRMMYGVGKKGDDIDDMVTLFIELKTAKI